VTRTSDFTGKLRQWHWPIGPGRLPLAVEWARDLGLHRHSAGLVRRSPCITTDYTATCSTFKFSICLFWQFMCGALDVGASGPFSYIKDTCDNSNTVRLIFAWTCRSRTERLERDFKSVVSNYCTTSVVAAREGPAGRTPPVGAATASGLPWGARQVSAGAHAASRASSV
jgi:hypothetical protein